MEHRENLGKKKGQASSSLAVIVGNRDIFPDWLAEEGGREVIKNMENLGFDVVTLFSKESGRGTIQTREDSKKCGELFRKNAEDIDGVLVTLPNFGDERSIAETLRLSKLNVPVLIHAFPDECEKMDRKNSRDSFCGKLSICNNLKQYGIPFTNTRRHVENPSSVDFKEDLYFFDKVCRVVNNLRNARLGVIGVRPNPFSTVRYSEKILEKRGISVEIIDMSAIVEQAKSLDEDASQMVHEKVAQIDESFSHKEIPPEAIEKIAKLSVVMSRWAKENDLDAIAVQCWPTIASPYGIVPCASMSLMSEELLPCACEADVMGALSMYALQLASNEPAALVDLNNNYGNDPDKLVVFHCSNFPRSFFDDEPKLGRHFRLHGYGGITGRIVPGPATFLRVSTDDTRGEIRSYMTEGEFTEDELETFGGYGVAKVKGLQSLLRNISDEGFEHHATVVHGHVADVLEEAVRKYLGWEIYRHKL